MTDMFLLLCKNCRIRMFQSTPMIHIHLGKAESYFTIWDDKLKSLLEFTIQGYRHNRLGDLQDFDCFKNNTEELYFDIDNKFIKLFKINGKGKPPAVIAMAMYQDPNWSKNFVKSYEDYLRYKKHV